MDSYSWKILLVEDDEDDYVLTRAMLAEARGGQFELVWASSYDAALELIRGNHEVGAASQAASAPGTEAPEDTGTGGNSWAAILVDYQLGEATGLDLVRDAVAQGCRAPIILLTGQGSYEVDVQAMRVGADDYLVKADVNAPLLERTIRYAIERKQAREALRLAHNELEQRVQERTQELARANQELRDEIAARQQATEALRASEARFRQLAETTSSAIFIVQSGLQGDESRIRYANPAAKLITGFSQAELLGMNFGEIAHPAYRKVLEARGLVNHWGSEAQIPSRYELKLLTRSGEERWVDLTAGEIEYEGRQALVVTIFDITERDLAEQALRKAKNELEVRVAERTAALRQANEQLAQANQQLGDANDQLAQANQQLQVELGERLRAAEERERLLAQVEQQRQHVEQLALKLEQERDTLQTIMENTRTRLAFLDTEYNFIRVNSAYAELLGLTSHELIGRNYFDPELPVLFPRPEDKAVFAQVRDTGEAAALSARPAAARQHSGDTYWDWSLTPVQDELGQVQGLVSSLLEVTESVHAAQERERLLAQLEAEQSRLQAIFENAPEAIVVADEECRIILTNPIADYLYARPVPFGQDYTSHSSLQICYPDGKPYDPRDMPLTRSTLDGEFLNDVELDIVWPDGQVRCLLVNSAPILDRKGQISGGIAMFQDITQRKQAEDEARRNVAHIEVQHYLIQHREMERLHIAQDLHDGPLQDLIGLSFMLQEAQNQAPPEKEADGALVARLQNAQTMLLQLIRELRSFSSELRPPALAPYGLEKAIRSHADGFQQKHPDLQIHLELEPDGQILSEQVRLALYRIYQESLNNVARHAQAKDVYVSLQVKPEETVLQVRDNGRGFIVPSDWLELARRGHLGLVGVQERAEAAGGRLAIRSTPEAGTSIQVAIPRLAGP